MQEAQITHNRPRVVQADGLVFAKAVAVIPAAHQLGAVLEVAFAQQLIDFGLG